LECIQANSFQEYANEEFVVRSLRFNERLFGIMHEYSITKNIVEISVSEALKAGAKKINSINIVIGELSSIIDDSVKMYFDIFAEGTIAEGAELIFKRIQAEYECKNCNHKFTRKEFSYECPLCKSLARPTDKGKEFYIESINID